jgi:hypothetical protein
MRIASCVLLLAGRLAAGVLEIGPIELTGSGTLSNPDQASYGGAGDGGLGLFLTASGSDGQDSVSLTVGDLELSGGAFFQDITLTNLFFDSGSPCAIQPGWGPTCYATIDGISGLGSFSNIGAGLGLVQVYSVAGWGYPGALLAEAQVLSTVAVTSVTYGLGGSWCPTCPKDQNGSGSFQATFDILDPPLPPSNVPEPGSLWLVGLALLGLATYRCRRLKTGAQVV